MRVPAARSSRFDAPRPRAFSIWRDTRVWIDSVNRWLVIDTAAGAKTDEMLGLLSKSVAPNFSIDQDEPPRGGLRQ